MLKFLLFFFLVIHTSAYSFEANQQEGICGPDAESVKECTDPSLDTNAFSSPVQEMKKHSGTVPTSIKAPASTPHKISTSKENYSPALNQDEEKSADDKSSPENRAFVIHFFWGSGCPHCKDEKVFLDEMKKRYPQMKILDYEVWYDRENAALLG
ncbi:MAG: thioredoxin family protein, partial [Thermodesulfovibrionales bacterium]|nr:thioredoxin family protein [Thermodesulfovibrionales bacterium]